MTRRSIVLRYFTINGVVSQYLLIFRQNSINADYFQTDNECLYANSPNKYSILGYINDDFMTDDVFEFILEYPEISEYGHWTQTVNPLEATHETNVNLKESNSSWKKEVEFIGLHKSSVPHGCFLEGSPEPSGNRVIWYFSIATRVEWSYKPIIPGCKVSSTPEIHEAFLWLKITNLALLRRIQALCTCQKHVIDIRIIVLCSFYIIIFK